MDESVVKFTKVLETLLKKAQSNNNTLGLEEINDAFEGMELTPDKMDWVLEYFEKQKIDIMTAK